VRCELLTDRRSASAITRLPDTARRAMAAHWRRRAASERRIGRGFELIAPRLRAVAVAPGLVARCEAAAREEVRHAELCRRLAALYAGADEPSLSLPDVEVPEFATGDERLEVALLLVGTCCINETLATAYISACLAASTVPCAVLANRTHLREEIGHGRLGWALLASPWLDDRLRAALAPRLSGMLAANVPLWLRPDPWLAPDGVPGFGHPAHAVIRATIERAVAEVVVPGFAHVGLDLAQLAPRWRGSADGLVAAAASVTPWRR
jgi:hypothetical protein